MRWETQQFVDLLSIKNYYRKVARTQRLNVFLFFFAALRLRVKFYQVL